MSLIETVKEMYAAFGRGDIAAIQAAMDPEVSWEVPGPESLGYTGMMKGPAATMRFFGGIAERHTDIVLEMTDYFERGNLVGVFGRYDVTLRRSGRRVSTHLAHLWEFRDGKVVRYVNYGDTAAFLED